MRNPIHSVLVRLALGLVLVAGLPLPAQANDADLFTTTAVAPNVLLVMDNSASMNHMIWHEDYDPAATYSCDPGNLLYGAWDETTTGTGAFDPSKTYFFDGSKFGYYDALGAFQVHKNWETQTHCARTRKLFADNNASGNQNDANLGNNQWSRFTGGYLNWLFSAESDAAWVDLVKGNNGLSSACTGGTVFSLYQRTRMNVAKQVLKDVICQVNLVGQVRFGIATFRGPDAGTDDPNGGYVVSELGLASSGNQADLVSAIQSLRADTNAPLGETLFQMYTYFMSRVAGDLPIGADNATAFPLYTYSTSSSGVGGKPGNSLIADPVQFTCQKNFVILVTDGDPTKDDFDKESPADTSDGFENLSLLIGNYVPDAEVEDPGSLNEEAFWLDDIAGYMTDTDMRPDMAGNQTVDTYTVGFTTSAAANDLLNRTAFAGNGIFFPASNESELAKAIIDALTSIIEKAQSFTAATVPASRTVQGNQIYISLFTPTSKTGYWDGRLRAYGIDGTGRILDKFGNCALNDPTGQCFSGPFLDSITSPPHWDASDKIPAPMSRNLLVSRLDGAGAPEMVEFRHALNTPAPFPSGPLSAADLGVVFPPPTTYSLLSLATDAEQLAAEVVANVRGCEFPGGTSLDTGCIPRITLLNDIFHSNPVVVGTPGGFLGGTYPQFVAHYTTNPRDRVIYAGSNGGFFHGFHAGNWDGVNKVYTPGTGIELFGFMPYLSRMTIKEKPLDNGSRDYYYVDGSPTVADVRFYDPANADITSADWRDWKTIVVTSMREGGGQYAALEITDPAGANPKPICVGYPCYMWEFPAENDSSANPSYMGETWGDPIITKIQLDVGGTLTERWVVVVTGGYADSGDPNRHAAYTANDRAGRSVWILDAMTGQPIASRVFDDATAGASCAGAYDPANPEAHMCYAMSATPAVYDVDGNGFSDLIVLVDLGGQMWKWVIEAPGFDPVNTIKTVADNDNTVWPFRKFFQAPVYNDGTNNFYKSFYFSPAATKDGNTLWLAAGTGERNELLFMGDTGTTADNNRYYVLKDIDWNDSFSPTNVITEANLLDVSNTSTCSDPSAYSGFYFLGAEGEKWVTNADLFQYNVIVSSYIPVPSLDPCDIGGQAFLYVFRVDCGEGYFTDPGTGAPTRALDLGVGLPTDPRVSVGPNGSTRVVISKQGGDIISIQGPPGGTGDGMFYWRELTD